MDMLKKCFNPKVLVGLSAVAILIAILAPKAFVGALPLLFIAACPLSMILMMGMMGVKHDKKVPSKEIDILRQRYAKGDISEQEFEQMKKKLQTH